MKKKCRTCGKLLSHVYFHKDKTCSQGLCNQCKVCACLRSKEYRERNWKKVNEKARKKAVGAEWKKILKKYRQSKKSKMSMKKSHKKWILNNREKRSSGEKLRAAIKNGILQKNHCKYCGNKEVQGHHWDYSKPLDVVWLCRDCHTWEHRIIREWLRDD